MSENTQNFLKLVKESPDLPIVPMVHYEVIGGDDYSYWLGSFGKAVIGEYAIYNDRYFDDRDSFMGEFYDGLADELNKKFSYNPRVGIHQLTQGLISEEEYEENRKNEALLDKYLEEVADRAFTKAIMVYINSSEEENFHEEVKM